MSTTSSSTAALPFQPSSMSPAQLAAVSFLARYSGATHRLYRAQLGRWFAWCESNGLDPVVGIQRARVELYIRELGDAGLMDSSVNTRLHAVRGYFRSRTSTAPSRPTRPCRPGSRRSSGTSPGPRAWTGWS
ncbi:site-specific integrase [Ornithinimicrobium cerasi]|uniref:Phage integrase, N-terminal SAM-like domain n=1 Tax=Ornithinimicrobium cerasi TaxID=2248773 RepID=A0A285VAW5_9MICO|nr:site-specific integrase [Ornithinimicrobium cerasi]SOC51107.1 Phage integrase, N-terminal SAM-like domain [Ornithinimicrobium cerasi]